MPQYWGELLLVTTPLLEVTSGLPTTFHLTHAYSRARLLICRFKEDLEYNSAKTQKEKEAIQLPFSYLSSTGVFLPNSGPTLINAVTAKVIAHKAITTMKKVR